MEAQLGSTTPAPPPLQMEMRGPFMYLPGGFHLGHSSVPFYSVTMRVEDAVAHVRLPSEFPVSPERPVDLGELFQRELDVKRVKDGLLPYLRGSSDLRFFNSITVALLPLEQVGTHMDVADSYAADDAGVAPTPSLPGYDNISVGQITLTRRPGDTSHGYVSWNPSLTFPVVLDGQHRLYALKEALKDEDFPGRVDLANTRISLLLLILDERAGYEAPHHDTVLGACRSIFIDLNKYAKGVSKARQYLLDETDLTASCLRAILEDDVRAFPQGTVSERVHDSSRLPLALIDWRGETAKFDGESPFVSTVLALHGVVEAIVDLKEPASDDYEGLRRYIAAISARLLSGDEAGTLRQAALDRLAEHAEEERPFALTKDEISALAKGFQARFGGRLTRPLVELKPYAALIDSLTDIGVLGSGLEAYLSLDPSGRRQLLTQLEAPSPEEAIKQTARAVKSGNLAFQVVFQRGALLSLHSLASFHPHVAEYWGRPDDATDDSEDFVITEWINRWNSRVGPALADGASPSSPLVGAGIRPEGNIDFRKTRIPSIAGLMTYAVLAPSELFSPEPALESFESWIQETWSYIQPGGWADPLKSIFSYHGARWRKALHDVLVARGLEESDDQLRQVASEQLLRIATARSPAI
jgi:hypothetical protein